MCGIAGSKSRESGYDLYLQNLTRGYYSSSVTVLFKRLGGFMILKKEGKFELNDIPPGGEYYLFHSRGPTVETTKFDWDDNHPFTFGKFSVAHNGIIENADHIYGTEIGVDSRVIPYVLEDCFRNKVEDTTKEVVVRSLEKLKGTFGLWVLDHSTFEVRIVRHDITLFSYGTEFSSTNPGYMTDVPQDTILKFNTQSNTMEIEGTFKYAGKPKYFVPESNNA